MALCFEYSLTWRLPWHAAHPRGAVGEVAGGGGVIEALQVADRAQNLDIGIQKFVCGQTILLTGGTHWPPLAQYPAAS